MTTRITQEVLQILGDALKELESSKGSVLSGVQKLSRAAKMIGDQNIEIWCEIQFGNRKYTEPLKKYIEAMIAYNEKNTKTNVANVRKIEEQIKKLGLEKEHFTLEELNAKATESGGGYSNIGFVEEKYADLVRRKIGNDRTYYKSNLNSHLNYVKTAAHQKATILYNKIAFSNTPQTCFDLLKNAIDDKLLDFNPELAEKLMTAFRAVTTDNKEEWSQALTTCRRFIENLADELYPPIDEKINGRLLGKEQYINRMWAFMDKSIESESNKELAKAHVDFLGSYLQRLHKLNNKGVHTNLERLEAAKAVFHTYLLTLDILEYIDNKRMVRDTKINIHSASLDEIQSFLDVNKNIAKEIIKIRVEKGKLFPQDLGSIKGIGPKTIKKAEEVFDFESIA